MYVLEPVEALLISYQLNISKVPRQFTFVRERYAPENPQMFTSAVEKYIRTVNTYRILRFHGENRPFEDSLFCHKFECGRRHFEKQLCNLVGKTTSEKSTQMVDQNARSKNGFCLICCLAAGAWVRIIRVRVQPWYESSTLLVSGQVTKQQSSFMRIRRKVTLLSRMSQRGFSWRKKNNRFRKHTFNFLLKI